MRPDEPAELGPFRLLGRLGSGGMGTVYVGHGADGRSAAVKVIHQNLADDPTFRARFAREIETARLVDAPWAARVLDADPRGYRPWLATEFITGPSLEQCVASAGSLAEDAVVELGITLARALAELHACGIVHRDLKPANVLLAPDGPRLIDFGIAHVVDTTRITQAGTALGTPAFMSPEQACGEECAAPSDVFSLASVLVFAATGSGPFGRASSDLAMMLRVSRHGPDLSGVPARLRDALADCFATDPGARPTAAVLGERLAAVPAAVPEVAGHVPAPATVTSLPAPREPARSPRWPLGVAGVALLAMVAIVVVVVPRSSPARTVPAAPPSAPLAPTATARELTPNARIRVGNEPGALAISPDSRRAAVATDDHVALVDLASGTVRTVDGLRNVTSMAWSPDGSRLYAGHRFAAASIVDSIAGTVIKLVPGTKSTIDLVVSPDGRTGWALLASPRSVVRVDLAQARTTATLPLSFEARTLTATPDGSTVYVVGQGTSVAIDTAAGGVRAHESPARDRTAVVVAGDGRTVVIGDVVALHDAGGAFVRDIPSDLSVRLFAGGVAGAALSPGGDHLFVVARPGPDIAVLDTRDGRRVADAVPDGAIDGMALAPDGSRLVAAAEHGDSIWLIDTSAFAT